MAMVSKAFFGVFCNSLQLPCCVGAMLYLMQHLRRFVRLSWAYASHHFYVHTVTICVYGEGWATYITGFSKVLDHEKVYK
jgi:hypothetical protein